MDHYGSSSGENMIECPQCGTEVYYELTRCPHCGLNFFPLEGEEQLWSDEYGVNPDQVSRHAALDWKTALAAWFVSGAFAFLINLVLSRITSGNELGFVGSLILFLSAPLGAAAGGYLAGQLARRKPLEHGVVVGVLSIVNGYLLDAYWYVSPLRWEALLSWLLTFAAAVGLTYWSVDLANRSLYENLFSPRSGRGDLYQDLLSRVNHDRKAAERLIQLEARQHPGKDRTTLIQFAIERWQRDNR